MMVFWDTTRKSKNRMHIPSMRQGNAVTRRKSRGISEHRFGTCQIYRMLYRSWLSWGYGRLQCRGHKLAHQLFRTIDLCVDLFQHGIVPDHFLR